DRATDGAENEPGRCRAEFSLLAVVRDIGGRIGARHPDQRAERSRSGIGALISGEGWSANGAGPTLLLTAACLALAVVLMAGCGKQNADGGQPPPSAAPANPNTNANSNTNEAPQPAASPEEDANENLVPISDLDTADVLRINRPGKGDLDEILKRRFIRALVVYNKTTYFMDGTKQGGVAYDSLAQFEKWFRSSSESGSLAVKVGIIPTARDRLIQALAAGYGDVAIGNLTITPERQKLVDFTDPVINNIQELVITGPTAPPIATLDDLSGKEVYVRVASSYQESLDDLNKRFHSEGKAPVIVHVADKFLEDEDLI